MLATIDWTLILHNMETKRAPWPARSVQEMCIALLWPYGRHAGC